MDLHHFSGGVFQVSFVTPSLVPSVTVTGLGSAVKVALGCSVNGLPAPDQRQNDHRSRQSSSRLVAEQRTGSP